MTSVRGPVCGAGGSRVHETALMGQGAGRNHLPGNPRSLVAQDDPSEEPALEVLHPEGVATRLESDEAQPVPESVDAVARSIISDAGYRDYFIHRTGHGIGMDTHEHPYLVEGNSEALEPGMAFSIEPGIYIPGEFGVRLEDDMYITADGAKLFSQQSPSIEQPFV